MVNIDASPADRRVARYQQRRRGTIADHGVDCWNLEFGFGRYRRKTDHGQRLDPQHGQVELVDVFTRPVAHHNSAAEISARMCRQRTTLGVGCVSARTSHTDNK
jgi:hypothetical protein